MREFGFSDPRVDKWAMSFFSGYSIIRGREQQLLDYHGVVGSPNIANSIRAVAKWNRFGFAFHAASSSAFGEIHSFTGWIFVY